MVALVEPRGSSETSVARRTARGSLRRIAWLTGLLFACATGAVAADLEEAETLFRTGKYDECAKAAADAIRGGEWSERWRILKVQSELARGKDVEALASLTDGLRRFPGGLCLRLLGRDVFRYNGRAADVPDAMDTIERVILSAPQRFDSAEGRVALGRYFLLRGADARKVLDQFFDVARKQDPDLVEAYLATAELALGKDDEALAAETLAKAPKAAATDPRYHLLLARALSTADRPKSVKELAEALKINPRHADSLLLAADHQLDSEKYDEAEKTIRQVLEVNPRDPRAFALLAVIAHLKSDRDGEKSARKSALARWDGNPEVDHLIGRKLSQKYRFAEGSAYQKTALAFDPDYLPAKVQLCQDLLRLGDEAEGWALADAIFAKDGYNVVAYNLVTLRDRLAGFRTLQADGFVVRMDPREADLYGPRVLDLLKRARKTLCEKYGVTIKEPVIVEIFPQKKEFAVRTFGLPGAEGFLGVCFGRVITANSPASQGENPSNWEAVLWHEFCHVVTLNKTRNKMPRWLSEGISVYEEQRQDPSWGEPLSPKFRAMLLDDDDFTPLSGLSSAFMAPETPQHLQFAYFESALAVEFLVERFGASAVNLVLDDLGSGLPINEALPRRTKMSLNQLDREFAGFAVKRTEDVARGLTWEEPDLPANAPSDAVETWLAKNPKSFDGLRLLARRLMAEEKWQRAKEVLESLKKAYPDHVGAENAYVLLANVYRRLSDPAAEHAVLEELARRDGSAGPAYMRLMEMDEAARDWSGVSKNARRLLAVNPLIPTPHRQLARASEELGHRDEALAAYRALALLDENDPAEVHFRLAKLLKEAGKTSEARREVLKSLEDAPRFRNAHRLLLELVGPGTPATTSPAPAPKPRAEGRTR
jgi:tetratricopeptide (TPR) repeat protein